MLEDRIMPVPVIRTPRTVLTLLTPEQAPLIEAYYSRNRARLARWEPERPPGFFTLEAWRSRLADWRERYRSGTALCFSALNHEQTRMLASCHFTNIVHGVFQACHVGYSVDGAEEGGGLMREVLEAGIAYMFEDVGLHRIMANYMPVNERSAGLLARVGFEREGYARQYLKIAGRWEDHVLTALLAPADRAGS